MSFENFPVVVGTIIERATTVGVGAGFRAGIAAAAEVVPAAPPWFEPTRAGKRANREIEGVADHFRSMSKNARARFARMLAAGMFGK